MSLAAVGNWIRSLGQLDSTAFGEGKPLPPRTYPLDSEISALSVTLLKSKGDRLQDEGRGEPTKKRLKMTAIKHSAVLSETPVREDEAPMRLNAHSATWLPRDL